MKNFQINRILPLTFIEQSFALHLHLRLEIRPRTTSNTRINYWLVQWLIKFPIAYRITISWMMLLEGIDCLGGATFQPNIFNGSENFAVLMFGDKRNAIRLSPIVILDNCKPIEQQILVLPCRSFFRLPMKAIHCVESFPIISIRLMILSIYVSQIIRSLFLYSFAAV